MRITTKADLNKIGCRAPDCTHEDDDVLYLHAGCHVWSPLEVSYEKSTGRLTLECAECNSKVTVLEIK